MFAYPKNNQSSDQQLRDEYDCYTLVQQQTGINPDDSAAVRSVCCRSTSCPTTGRRERATSAREDGARSSEEGLPEERRSERSLEMQAEVRPLERLSVQCAAEESSARRTSSPRNRRRSRQVHKRNSKPIKPRPHTTSKWIPSSEDSRLAWMRADIRSNRFTTSLKSTARCRKLGETGPVPDGAEAPMIILIAMRTNQRATMKNNTAKTPYLRASLRAGGDGERCRYHDPNGRHPYVRQLRGIKLKPKVEVFNATIMAQFGEFCGWTLARAHVRSGESAMIGGYRGKRATCSIRRSPLSRSPMPTKRAGLRIPQEGGSKRQTGSGAGTVISGRWPACMTGRRGLWA